MTPATQKPSSLPTESKGGRQIFMRIKALFDRKQAETVPDHIVAIVDELASRPDKKAG